jgi:hypothetical protein
MVKKQVPSKKPGAPIVLSIYESDLKCLRELAFAKGLRIAEVLHLALASYSNTVHARILLEREEDNLAALTMAS